TDRTGLVKLSGEEWTARTAPGTVLPVDETVHVLRIEGATAVVEPMPEPQQPPGDSNEPGDHQPSDQQQDPDTRQPAPQEAAMPEPATVAPWIGLAPLVACTAVALSA